MSSKLEKFNKNFEEIKNIIRTMPENNEKANPKKKKLSIFTIHIDIEKLKNEIQEIRELEEIKED